MISFKRLILLMGLIVAVTGSMPLWKSLLIHHKVWIGFYDHDSENHPCELSVRSVGLDEMSTSLVSFSAEHISIDMSAFVDDNKTVIFKEEATWNKSHHFVGHTNLVITGAFVPDSLYYKFTGNVSSNEALDFGTISLTPKGSPRRTFKGKHSHLSYGLAIGIPVTLAVMLMIAGVLILRWGIKKGYLRHVPRAYKYFTNPRRSRPDHEMNENKSQEQSEETEVYI